MTQLKKGDTWMANRTYKPHLILKVTINDVHYVAATITLASGKIFIKSHKDFKADYTRLESTVSDKLNEAIKNTVERYNLGAV